MANNLDLSATLELIDKISAPLRTIEGQVENTSDKFNDTKKVLRDLSRQQGMINSLKDMEESFGELGEQVNQAQDRVREFERQIASTSNPSQTLINRLNSAQRSLTSLEQRFESGNRNIQSYRQRMREAGVDVANLGNEERRIVADIERANQALGRQRQQLARLRNAQAQSQKMEQMRNSSAMLAMKGAGAIAGGAMFMKSGMDLEKTMSKVQALTRLDQNSEQFKALKEQAMALGSSTAFTSADAGRGQAFLAMAGFTPEAIQKALPSVLDLALAGDMELPQVADISSNILSGMGLDPSEMSKVGDVLSTAFTRANVDIAMLGETMKYAAPGAEGLNISLEELAAMAGKLGDAGIQGSEGGTALRSIMSRLASTPAPVAKALAKLGIASKDAQGNLRPLPTLLKEINEKTKNMGTAERNEMLTKIAGMEASNALQVLAKQAGNGELDKLINTLQGSDGALKQLSATMNNNTLGDFTSLQSAMDGFRTSIFESNKENIRAVIQAITELTAKFTTFANAHPQLIATLGVVFGLLAGGAVIIGGLGAVMLTVLAPMAMLRASLITLGLPTTLTPLSMLSTTIMKLGSAFKMVFTIIMNNPILRLISLLVMLGFLIYQNRERLGQLLQGFLSFYDSCVAVTTSFIERIANGWNNLVQRVINFANQLWSNLGIKFNSGIMALIAIIVAFSPVGLFIQAFSAVWTFFSGLSAKFRNFGSNMIEGLKQGILGKAQAVISSVTSIASRIKNAFTSARGMDIHSPSRVFAGYGDYIMQGLNQGLLANNSPIQAMLATSNNLRNAIDTSAISFDTRKPIMATMGMGLGASMGMAQAQPININIYTQPNQNEQQIAQLVAQELNKQQGRNNNALYDMAEEF